MDINTHVDSIVQNIISDITSKVQAQVSDVIAQKINEVVDAMDYSSMVSDKISQHLDAKIATLPIDKTSMESVLSRRIENLAENLSVQVQKQAIENINNIVLGYVNKIDFATIYDSSIVNAIQNRRVSFPVGSIASSALCLDEFSISGDHVQGGIIKQFGSTGIDDKATMCQLTIMDDITVVENNLLTKDLTVKGSVLIEGDLDVTGSVSESSALFKNVVSAAANSVRATMDQVALQSFADMALENIKTNGIDLNRITIGGQDIINGNAIGNFVVNSNLQKVGLLKELQVSGETYLSDTLYTSQHRVGINTIEPNTVLSIWDQEVEVSVSKDSSNTAIIETPRNQALILSSNAKKNMSLNTDGSVSMTKINLNNVSITSSDIPPADVQPRGCIVFNACPSLGGPLGWVSLGDAKWSNFGIID